MVTKAKYTIEKVHTELPSPRLVRHNRTKNCDFVCLLFNADCEQVLPILYHHATCLPVLRGLSGRYMCETIVLG